VTSSWEELGYACGVETCLGKTKSCPQTGSSNNDGIVFVILYVSIRKVSFLHCSIVHTTTGYLLLTNGEASFARRGACVIMRAMDRSEKG
jgi:hypothetical protein